MSKGRPPHGGRGLKYRDNLFSRCGTRSSPSRGTWIEIRGFPPRSCHPWSSPSRGTWIEIRLRRIAHLVMLVVPLTGDVD